MLCIGELSSACGEWMATPKLGSLRISLVPTAKVAKNILKWKLSTEARYKTSEESNETSEESNETSEE